MKYIVVEGVYIKELMEQVNRLLLDGWRCQGGVQSMQTKPFGPKMAVQAMIKDGLTQGATPDK